MCTSAFAHGSSPISGQGLGRRQAVAGRTQGQGQGLPCALPPLRTVIRHTSGMVRHCARGRPPLPSPSPTLRTAARDTGSQRRRLFSGAARTLPGSGRRANDILYIRVRRREGEHVLHRAASNDVDNFSVDNPLWITAAAGGRLLCGGRGRRCRGSVNAGTKMQTQTGRVRKSLRAMGARRGRLSAPWPRFHGADRANVYIIIHVRACCCGECALNPPTAQPIPRRRPPLAPTQRHALPEHFRSPTQRRRTPAGCAMHSPPKTSSRPRSTDARHRSPDARPPTEQPIPHRRLPLAPAQRHALAEHFRSPHAAPTHARRLRDAFPTALTTHSPQRHTASPSVPLRAQKNGTAQCMCDAECFGRPSLRSVIWVGEPRAVRRRCGALACRRGA